MQEGDFPSLAKRAYEDVPANSDPVSPPVSSAISVLPGPLQSAVSKAVRQSSSAHAKFLRNLPGVKKRVNNARGSAISSEAWVVAQMDLSALEIGRGPSISALADIDGMYISRLEAEYIDNDPGGAAIIAEKRELIRRQVKSQQDEIDAMKAQLR